MALEASVFTRRDLFLALSTTAFLRLDAERTALGWDIFGAKDVVHPELTVTITCAIGIRRTTKMDGSQRTRRVTGV